MLIDNLDQVGAAVTPDEADAPSVIDPDAVRPTPVAPERLQGLSGRRSKIRKAGCLIEHVELAQRYRFDRFESGNGFAFEQRTAPRYACP